MNNPKFDDRRARVRNRLGDRGVMLIAAAPHCSVGHDREIRYSADPEFYAFVRSLEAYRKSIGEGTTLVLSPDQEFFEYFGASGANAP